MDNYRNKMKIIYNKEEIEIDTIFTISDLYNNKSIKDITDYRLSVANIISNHSYGKLIYKDIYDFDESIIDEFIEKFVSSDELLTKNYKVMDVDDKYEKFILSIERTKLDYSKKFSKTVNKILSPTVANLNETINKTSSSKLVNLNEIINKTLSSKLVNLNETVNKALSTEVIEMKEIVEKYTAGIGKQLEPLKKFQSEYSDYIKQVMNPLGLFNGQFESLLSNIRESIKNIKIPTITEVDKERLLENCSKFGKLGWTIHPNADFFIFNNPPQNEADAYRIFKEYTNKKNMEELFIELLQIPRTKKSDLNEAIDCFNNRQYKACALIIFSIIDARLIRSQPKKGESKKYRRPAGNKAVNKLFKRIETNYIKETMFITQLYQVNILEALKIVFEDGDDFKKQPTIINRNFLTHGMMHRKVHRKDCVMLFLLLFNFYEYINSFIDY